MSSDEARPSEPPSSPSSKHWDPGAALDALKQERAVMDFNIHDPTQVAEAVAKTFRENAQLAALGIVHASLYESNPKIRLDASKYVIEHAVKVAEGDNDPLVALVSEFYG